MNKIRFIVLVALIVLVNLVQAQAYTKIKVTEIMYNAPDYGATSGSSFDFIELKNTGSTSVDMSGYYFADGLLFTFPSGSNLAAGQFFVIASDTSSFKMRYPGVGFLGQWADTLANGGERIQIATAAADTFISITYNDDLPWPILADGNGWSLVPVEINPTTNQKDAEDWRASADTIGSPGADDGTPPSFANIQITECLSNSRGSEVDAVELYNATGGTVDLSGWLLSDNRNNPKNYIIPQGTTMNAGEYLVFDELDFNTGSNAFVFSRTGDHVLLFAADNDTNVIGFVDGYEMGAQFNGISFGRWETSTGDVHFVAQKATSLGFANDSPKVGPVVITHINYKPLNGNPPAPSHEEYLVLKNIADSTVNLYYNKEGVTYTDTTWKVLGVGGFKFPAGTSMLPGEYVILTDETPSFFRSENGISSNIKVFQYSGSLNNKSDNIRVVAPDKNDTTDLGEIYTPYVLIDQVEYLDTVPWPIYADEGFGYRLDRINDNHYGNDPANWGESNGGLFDFLPTSIFEHQYNGEVEVYPNPSSGLVNFVSNTEIQRIKVFSADGKLVRLENVNSLSIELKLTDLESGVYIYEVETNQVQKRGKMIIR